MKKREVLERVHGGVVQRGVVEERDVPDVEIDCPQRQRDERVRQDAEPLDGTQREHRPQDRAGEPGDEAERREIAEDHVLQHVHEEEVLLAERVDRRVERRARRARSRSRSTTCRQRHRLAPRGERARAAQVEHRDDQHCRHDLERLERPRSREATGVHGTLEQ